MIVNDGKPIADFTSKSDRFILSEDFVYVDSQGNSYTVPAGFITDGASIPKILFFWSWGKWDIAAIVHDYCYTFGQINNQKVDKKFADTLFYKMLLELEVNKVSAFLMYLAVRLFGRGVF